MRNVFEGRWGTPVMVGTTLTALLAAVLAAPTLAMDSGTDSIHLTIAGKAGTLEEVDVSHLEVGDSEQLFTDNGESVLLTRTESGLDVEVGEQTIEVRFDRAGDRMTIGDAAGDQHVSVQHLGGGDGESVVWVSTCEEGSQDCRQAQGHSFRQVIVEEQSTAGDPSADSASATGDSQVKVFVVKGEPGGESSVHVTEDHQVRIDRIGDGGGTTITVKRVHKSGGSDGQ